MSKKILTIISILIIVSLFSFSLAASKFNDVNGTKYEAAVTKLNTQGVIDGFPDGTFRPNADITRAQLAKLLVEGLKLKAANNVVLTKFSDLNTTMWSYQYIKIAVDNNILVGYTDGTIGPNKQVKYSEAITMIIRAMDLEKSMTDKTWPSAYVTLASSLGLLSNVYYENVNDYATRGEVSVSLYNMVNKIETDKQKAEQEKAEEEAKKNAFSFAIAGETGSDDDDYYVKIGKSSTETIIKSIKESTKLTDSKVEALEDNVFIYRENKNNIDIVNYYTPADLDKAKIISSISSDKQITFKDKSVWKLADTTLQNTYKLYNFARVTCSVDSDDYIVFDKVAELGIGITKVTFDKDERVYIDDSNKVILVIKGFEQSDVIKKGYVNSDAGEDYDTSAYDYGFVTSEPTTYTVKIDKIRYDIDSKSSEFEVDTYVVFTTNDKDEIKLYKSFGVKDIDKNAEIIDTVSGKKGSQKVYYKGKTKQVDFTNTKTYKNYNFAIFELEWDSKGKLFVIDKYTEDEITDINFAEGDRVIIDAKTKVFAVFKGLEVGGVAKNGTYSTESEESNKKYTVSYKWKSSALKGVDLPASESVKSGTTYYVSYPSEPGYSFTSSLGDSFKVTANTTVYISYTKKTAYKATYKLAPGDGSIAGIITLPDEEAIYKGDTYTVKKFSEPGYVITTEPTGSQTVKGNIEVIVYIKKSKDQMDKEKRIAELEKLIPTLEKAYKDASAKIASLEKAVTDAKSAETKAKSDMDKAEKTMNEKKNVIDLAYDMLIKPIEDKIEANNEKINELSGAIAQLILDLEAEEDEAEKAKIQKQITDKTEELKAEKDDLATNEKALKAANESYAEKEDEYKKAKTAYESAQTTYKNAQKAVTTAENALKDGNTAVSKAEKEWKDAKAELEELRGY